MAGPRPDVAIVLETDKSRPAKPWGNACSTRWSSLRIPAAMKAISVVPLLLALAVPACGKKAASQSETTAATAAASAQPSATAKTAKPAKPELPAPADVAAPPATAEKTDSGLASVVLKAGDGGDKPGENDTVKVHYTGWTKDGKMFDSSETRKRPATFGVKNVIKGWTEGLQLMTVGEKRRFWIPANLAYGEKTHGGRPSGQLTFDVELLELKKAPPPPPVPEDLLKPPATAKKTKTGLKYNVLTKGTGKDHPTAESRVSVHYSGWTKDGKMFDSSIVRGRPASFGLNRVISGWTEGLQLMVEGEKTRFWIPADLAYGDPPKRPGAPAGDLVFDVELLKVMGSSPANPHMQLKSTANAAASAKPAHAPATPAAAKPAAVPAKPAPASPAKPAATPAVAKPAAVPAKPAPASPAGTAAH
jgi:peptidylprolyl isomerase